MVPLASVLLGASVLPDGSEGRGGITGGRKPEALSLTGPLVTDLEVVGGIAVLVSEVTWFCCCCRLDAGVPLSCAEPIRFCCTVGSEDAQPAAFGSLLQASMMVVTVPLSPAQPGVVGFAAQVLAVGSTTEQPARDGVLMQAVTVGSTAEQPSVVGADVH